jgi:HAD superfamily hydrolase (TIGR01549 family)
VSKVFLFDLDMTLVNSGALSILRRAQLWNQVKANLHLVKSFPPSGQIAPHDLPKLLRKAGHKVGIVTSSPKWYAEEIIKAFAIEHDVLISHGDTTNHKPDPEPLNAALKALGVGASKEVYYVGDDVADTEAAYHAGLTSIGIGWGLLTFSAVASAAPDLFLGDGSLLLRTGEFDGFGYAGEVLTSGRSFVDHWGTILRCESDPQVYALGRYFTASDPRHGASALCTAVLSLKNNDTHAEILGQAVGRTGENLDGWRPRYIVPVPPKPSQNRNRFEKVLITAKQYLPESVNILVDGLKCVKEVAGYKQMNGGERQEAIKGAFATGYNWHGNDVLLLDDVYTTGETVKECVRVLKASGAGEVRCLTLAGDQRAFIHKQCPSCHRSMKIRTNSQGQKFWGCSGYPHYCQNTENL